jgi:hypothetical protein
MEGWGWVGGRVDGFRCGKGEMHGCAEGGVLNTSCVVFVGLFLLALYHICIVYGVGISVSFV